MTPAEQKRRKRREPEHARLLQLIKKRINSSENAKIKKMRRALDAIGAISIDDISYEQLREIGRIYTLYHDRKGRTSREAHTGGGRIEVIDAAARGDEYSEELWGGRLKRTGMTLDAHETGDADSCSALVLHAPNDEFWDHLDEFAKEMFDGEEQFDAEKKTLRCQVRGCGFETHLWVEARRHLGDLLQKAEAQVKLIKQIQEVVDSGVLGFEQILADARRAYSDHQWAHHVWVRRLWTTGMKKS